MTEFTAEQMLEICRMADDKMIQPVEKAAQNVIAEKTADPSDVFAAMFLPSDYMDDFARQYEKYGRIRQAAGSIDDTQHTRERFDDAVADLVATIERAP